MQPKKSPPPTLSFPAGLALVVLIAWLAAFGQQGPAAMIPWAILLGGIGAAVLTALLGRSSSDKSR